MRGLCCAIDLTSLEIAVIYWILELLSRENLVKNRTRQLQTVTITKEVSNSPNLYYHKQLVSITVHEFR